MDQSEILKQIDYLLKQQEKHGKPDCMYVDLSDPYKRILVQHGIEEGYFKPINEF